MSAPLPIPSTFADIKKAMPRIDKKWFQRMVSARKIRRIDGAERPHLFYPPHLEEDLARLSNDSVPHLARRGR